MKVNYNAWHVAMQQPPIPLKPLRNEVDTQDKNSYLTVELRYTPTDPDSRVYKKNVQYFKNGTPKQYIEFRADVTKIIVGQAITTGPAQYAMVRTLLRGDALRVFDNRATLQGAENVANLKLVLNQLGQHVFPMRALVKQKRHMRRFITKPARMPAREFLACLLEMNADLNAFPPYAADQALDDDEMLEIAEFALPVKWQKAMVEHDFNCSTKTIDQVIDFAERQETIENLERSYTRVIHTLQKKPRRRRSKSLRTKTRAVYLAVPSPLMRQGAMRLLTVVTIQKQPAVFTGQAIGPKTVKY